LAPRDDKQRRRPSALEVSISSTFYDQLLRKYSFAKKLKSQTVFRKKLSKALSNEKGACKMLMLSHIK